MVSSLLLLLLLLLLILFFLSSMSASFSLSFFPLLASLLLTLHLLPLIIPFFSLIIVNLSSLPPYSSSSPFSCSESVWIDHYHHPYSVVLFCRIIWRNRVDLMCNIGVNEIRNLAEQLAVPCRSVPYCGRESSSSHRIEFVFMTIGRSHNDNIHVDLDDWDRIRYIILYHRMNWCST